MLQEGLGEANSCLVKTVVPCITLRQTDSVRV